MQPVDHTAILESQELRDANLETLHLWHPVFRHEHECFDAVTAAFKPLLKRYWEYCKCECLYGERPDMARHLKYELVMRIAEQLDSMVDEITGGIAE